MSTESESIAIDRDIGNFFYNVTATRDAGVGLTEKTIDYIVDVKGEPDGFANSGKTPTTFLRVSRCRRTGRAMSSRKSILTLFAIICFWGCRQADVGRSSGGY